MPAKADFSVSIKLSCKLNIDEFWVAKMNSIVVNNGAAQMDKEPVLESGNMFADLGFAQKGGQLWIDELNVCGAVGNEL